MVTEAGVMAPVARSEGSVTVSENPGKSSHVPDRFAWRPGHPQPLIVAANRDEFYARPAQPLSHWADAPGVYAGRDLEAGGTWLGVGPAGRFAALTNIRDPDQPLGQRSRGELVSGFLTGTQPIEAYLDQVANRASEYSGFNLLLSDGQQLAYLSAREATPRLLDTGVYGLSMPGSTHPGPSCSRPVLHCRLNCMSLSPRHC